MATIDIDGVPLGCVDRRGGPGPPLLLVHGFTGSKEDFALVIDALAGDRRVVALDLPGHGESPGPDDPAAYSVAALASWVLRVADALDLGECHLLGHSLGGLVVQSAASVASHRLRSLVLADTGLGAPRDERMERSTRIALLARDEGLAAAWAWSRQNPPPDETRPDVAEDPERKAFEERRFLAMRPAAVVGAARSLRAAAPLTAFLRGIDLPVLVLHGHADDAWTPREQALLARTVNCAEYVVVPDSAHSPQLENPKLWLEAVGDFLLRADAATRN